MPARILLFLAALCFAASAFAQEASPHLAPGFTARTAGSRIVIAPADMELFSISAGGVMEPKADWTDAAQKYFDAALAARPEFGEQAGHLSESTLDEFAELAALQRAMAAAVFIHHASTRNLKLPTKDGRLDWTLGADVVRPLKEKTGADYALFTWLRDSYASNERKAVIVAFALLGSINTGGYQTGYSSLVDLNTGRIVWFNDVQRMTGDLRDPQSAKETVESLFKGFPAVQ